MAVIAKQRYKLDIVPKGGWVVVYASQHDDGAREIEFAITNQGNVFSIPASINVSVQGIKSNGSYFSHSCSYSGNIVTMVLADDMTDIIGKSICVLKFTNSSQQKLATAKFVLNIDTDSSSEGIIIDTDAEEIFNQMLNDIRAQASAISADIAELQSMVGSPLVASTVSVMTNRNKIYVYTGSESGYTNGNWYYWNGSAWTSGGVYNAVAINVDSTLTKPGQAADAKETGDRIDGVKNAINYIADSLEAVNGDVAIESEKWEIGGINFSTNGWEYGTNNKRIRTKEGFSYTLNAGDVIGLTDYTGKSLHLGILRTNGTYGYTGTLQSDYIVTTENVGQYAIVVRNTTEVALSSVEELLQYVKITRAESTISDINADMAMIDNTIGENLVADSTKSPNTHNGITFTPQNGGYKITGTATNTAFRNLYSSTSALPSWLKKGRQYYVTFKSDNVQLRVLPNGGGSTISLVNTKTNASFFIPDDTVGVTIRLFVDNGITVNETVYPIITEVETPNLSEHPLQKNTSDTYTYEPSVKKATGNLIHVDDVDPCSLLRISGAGTNDITVCGKNIYRNPHGMTTYTQNGVTKTFSENNGSIRVQSSGATNASVYPNPVTTVNGASFACLFKFSLPVDHVVTFSDNASRDIYMYDLVYMEISDGTNTTKLRGNPVTLLCKANVEYGVRIHANTGYSGDVTFYPQVELNGFATDFAKFCGAYRESGTVVSLNQRGTSPNNITADGNIATVISPSASVTLEYDAITKSNRASCGYYKEVESVGNKPKMLSFIDDDTANLSLVQLYHDTLEDIGIVGNYAVITSHLKNDDSLKAELLTYEAEGYGMLLHANEQNGEATDYFRPGVLRDFEACRQNLIAGLRDMHSFGFLSGDNWVSPYGVNDTDLQGLAKSLNLQCLVSTLNNTPVIHNKTNRYSIPRYSLTESFNVDIVKRGLDACEDGGWVLVTTHANEWGNNIETIASKIADIVTYAESLGFNVVNFQEGFKTFYN